jgi:hypothetical protein
MHEENNLPLWAMLLKQLQKEVAEERKSEHAGARKGTEIPVAGGAR